jgi:hypothetical protein
MDPAGEGLPAKGFLIKKKPDKVEFIFDISGHLHPF